MHEQARSTRSFGGVVARQTGVVSVVLGTSARYLKGQRVLAQLIRGHVKIAIVHQWMVILEPHDVYGQVALANYAGHVDPRTRLDVLGKAKRIDSRGYWKIQKSRIRTTSRSPEDREKF